MLRHNTNDAAPEAHDGSDWFSLDLKHLVTFGNLDNNGDVGDSATQVAPGDHGHLRDALLELSGTTTSNDPSGTFITLAEFTANPSTSEQWLAVLIGQIVVGGTNNMDDIQFTRDGVVAISHVRIRPNFNGALERYADAAADPPDGAALWAIRWHKQGIQSTTLEWTVVIIPYTR